MKKREWFLLVLIILPLALGMSFLFPEFRPVPSLPPGELLKISEVRASEIHCFDQEQIQVHSTSTGLTSSKYWDSTYKNPLADYVIIRVNTQDCYFTLTGDTPSASNGTPLWNKDTLTLLGFHQIQNFKVIRYGSTDAGISAIFCKEYK